MIKVGSDFSGVGAFNQALMRLGIQYEEIFACDMDKYARQTFIHNYGEPKYYPTNVYDREIPYESLDIYMTSPPCQAFSLAGKRLGKDDKRGILFFNSHEFIQVNKPRFFIFENVKGLLSDDGGKTFQEWVNMLGGKSVNGVPVIFPYEDSVSYHLYWKVLNAKHYGVPQNRERVFLIGIRDDHDNVFQFPKEEHLSKRLKDVLEDNVNDKYFLSEERINTITNPERSIGWTDPESKDSANCVLTMYSKNPTDGEYLKIKSATSKGYEEATDGDSINFSVPNSETRRGRVGKGVAQTLDTACNQGVMVAKVGRSEEGKKARKESMKKGKDHTPFQAKEITFEPSDTMNCITTATTKDNLIQVGDYRTDEGFRWRKDGNSPCIMASMRDTWKEGFSRENPPVIHKDYKIRRLTPRECFRLMDFPDTFTWPVSDSQAYKQAGNSIVVNVLYKILKQLPL
jgi:DNA (cytosine-5)-methyltransferase 1